MIICDVKSCKKIIKNELGEKLSEYQNYNVDNSRLIIICSNCYDKWFEIHDSIKQKYVELEKEEIERSFEKFLNN